MEESRQTALKRDGIQPPRSCLGDGGSAVSNAGPSFGARSYDNPFLPGGAFPCCAGQDGISYCFPIKCFIILERHRVKRAASFVPQGTKHVSCSLRRAFGAIKRFYSVLWETSMTAPRGTRAAFEAWALPRHIETIMGATKQVAPIIVSCGYPTESPGIPSAFLSGIRIRIAFFQMKYRHQADQTRQEGRGKAPVLLSQMEPRQEDAYRLVKFYKKAV